MQPIIGISFDQTNKHSDDLLQRLFTGPSHFRRAFTSHSEEAQCRRTLQSRPSCDIKESAPIRVRKFSVALSQIQQHRRTSSVQLVPHRSRLRKRHQHGFQPGNEGETSLVNLQFLVVKKSSRSISSSLHSSELYNNLSSPNVKQKLRPFSSSLNPNPNRNPNLGFRSSLRDCSKQTTGANDCRGSFRGVRDGCLPTLVRSIRPPGRS